ncbi:MAG: radical SAM protein [Bacteroidales bacterium]|nr:radical SAM protein [Bacteroidales bacterium]
MLSVDFNKKYIMETIRKVAIFKINEQNYIAFHFPTFTMLRVEEKNINAFKLLLEESSNDEEIAHNCNLEISYIKELKEQIPKEFYSEELFENDHQTQISQLTFLCSTNCNLRCKYCYAQDGSYEYPAENMPPETAEKTIEFFVDKYKNIASVLFFGGEALLNFEMIKAAVEKFKNLHLQGKISEIPRYSLISNGTLLNDEIIEYLSLNKFSLTISIDGNKIINDKLRIFPNGKGTFDVILNNILKIKKNYPNINIAWESTFTNVHESLGMTVEDVNNTLKEITGIEEGMIIPAIKSDHTNFEPNLKEVKKDLKKMFHDDWQNVYEGKRINDVDFLGTIVKFMDKSSSRYMCAMGFFLFSIAPNGDIFPCHMLTSGKKPDFFIGNINDDKDHLFSNIQKMSDKLKTYDKAKNSNCNNCFAAGFCGFCPAIHILENDFKVTEQYEDTCKLVQNQVKDFLFRMAEIRLDENKWNNLLKSVDISFTENTIVC